MPNRQHRQIIFCSFTVPSDLKPNDNIHSIRSPTFFYIFNVKSAIVNVNAAVVDAESNADADAAYIYFNCWNMA